MSIDYINTNNIDINAFIHLIMPPPPQSSRKATAVSDYESDAAANFTDTAPIIPPPPVRSPDELNLLVLRRWQPQVASILDIAPFAVLYLFSTETQAWEKVEVQGSLFVCVLRNGGYKLVILNRKGLENWEFHLRTEEAIQVTEEYVIVQKEDRDGEVQIYGIWIFEEKGGNTREKLGRVILGCAREAEALSGEAFDSEAGGGYGNEGEEEIVEGYDRTYAEEYEGQQREEINGLDAKQEVWPRQETPRQTYEVRQPPQGQPQGQQIDLATLFGKTSIPQAQPQSQSQLQPPPATEIINGMTVTRVPFAEERLAAASAPRFLQTADTDFFRGTAASTNPPQQAQQNALLNLFKNAKKG